MNLFYVYVLEKEDLEQFIEDGHCTCIEDIMIEETDFNWDYSQRALMDADKNEILIWNDNIHTQIDDDIENFIKGIKYSGTNVKVIKKVMMSEDLQKLKGVKY